VERLQWQLELLDRISSPADKANKATSRLQLTLKNFRGEMGAADRASRATAGGLESWVTKLNSAISIGSAVIGTIRNIAGAVGELTSAFVSAVVEQATFHESTMTTFNTLMGAAEGGREFNSTLRMSSSLVGGIQDFVSQRQQLLTGGFDNRRERDVAFAMTQDIGALNMRDSTVSGRAATIFSQILGENRATLENLNQLVNLNAGVSRSGWARAVISNRSGRAMESISQREVSALLRNVTGVNGQETLRAVGTLIQSRTHTAVGGFAARQGNSLTGRLSNLRDLPATMMQRWFARAGGATAPEGMRAFSDALGRINAMFNDGAPGAERLMRILDRLVNGVFRELFGSGNPEDVVSALLDTLENMVPVVISLVKWFTTIGRTAWPIFRAMLGPLMTAFGNSGNAEWFIRFLQNTGQALGLLGGVVVWFFALFTIGLVTVVGTIVDFVKVIGRWLAWLYGVLSHPLDSINALVSAFVNLGVAIVTGIGQGIYGAATAVWDAITSVATGAAERFRSLLGIHSPSRVFVGFGANITEGLALGIESGTSRIDSALGSLVPDFAPTITAAGVSARGAGVSVSQGGVSISLSFVLPEGATSPEAIGNAVRPVVLSAVAEAFERAALETGNG
jgi:hypothetical protein